MKMADFLKELPSHNEDNFTRFHTDSSCRSNMRKPAVYISTVDHPSEQVITTEKTNILLRYLHQQWDKKNQNKKRDFSRASLDSAESSSSSKMPRLNTDDVS
ncbi:DET1- and DDB1-associated protein 1-like [Crassostrea angulata]|uniref:DET1- and DDB1-associated protein 1 n=1 Tax=Magallana gigas TaxID=29159 RepID=A0A8W8HMN6_MAGGI|nr:DET1- and DDB1-associated protein 1 [Crassostrea gigas]XP_052697732.1 DET1- and DDB1-associated protein 1-like [Crassostrea angulata]|eukprot:XP_011447889.1 PREDICTED: DET1- and DDB1-associated protein 1-like [Crassostrea gigas]